MPYSPDAYYTEDSALLRRPTNDEPGVISSLPPQQRRTWRFAALVILCGATLAAMGRRTTMRKEVNGKASLLLLPKEDVGLWGHARSHEKRKETKKHPATHKTKKGSKDAVDFSKIDWHKVNFTAVDWDDPDYWANYVASLEDQGTASGSSSDEKRKKAKKPYA
jgi:hypothetical protein